MELVYRKPQLLEAMKGGSIDVGLPVGSAPGQVGRGNGLQIYFIANIVWGNEVIVLRKDLAEKVDVKKPQTLKTWSWRRSRREACRITSPGSGSSNWA